MAVERPDTLEAAARPQSVDEAPLMRTPVEIDGKRHMLGLPASLLNALGGLTQPAVDTPHTASKIDTMAILAPIAGTPTPKINRYARAIDSRLLKVPI